MNVDAVADQFRHDRGHLIGRADDARVPVSQGRHGVIEVGGVVRPRLKGGLGSLVVRHGVAHGDMDPQVLCRLDKFDGAGLLRSHGDQLYAALRRLLEAPQHGDVGVVEERAVLCALLGHAEEGTL